MILKQEPKQKAPEFLISLNTSGDAEFCLYHKLSTGVPYRLCLGAAHDLSDYNRTTCVIQNTLTWLSPTSQINEYNTLIRGFVYS